MAWHVIECIEGKDSEAYCRLAAAGFVVWRPTIEVRITERWRGRRLGGQKRGWKIVPVFGRYVFIDVQMSDSVYLAVREVAGVWGWLCWAGSDDPAIVPEDLIAHFRMHKTQAVDLGLAYSCGDTVRITEGPFVNHKGKVVRVDSPSVVCVELDIFGRLTPIPFPVSHVALVEQGRRPPIERHVRERQRKRA